MSFLPDPVKIVLFGLSTFSLGWILRDYFYGSTVSTLDTEGPSELDSLAVDYTDFKMVLVVRNDLKMGKGKIAAQCGHATLGVYKKLHRKSPLALERWEQCAQVKVVTKIETEEEMLLLQKHASKVGIASHAIIDAGRTQIAPNSRTVLALFGPDHLVNEVSGHLKLL